MKILIAALALAAAFLLQQYRFLSLAGVNPNLILVGLLFFVFRPVNLRFLAYLVFLTVAMTLLFTPFWLLEMLLVLLLAVAFYFIKRVMTGNRFFDFLIVVGAGTALFYAVLGAPAFNLPYGLILGEILYNLILGALIWYAGQKFTS